MTHAPDSRFSFTHFLFWTIQCLLESVLLVFLCSGTLHAQNAPETVTIKLPDGSDMHFKAVYLGIDGTSFFASRKITLGSREGNSSYKERLVDTLLSGSFVGTRNGKPDWLYYLGETEVSRSQWNSVMRWWDEQEGKNPIAEHSDNPQLPQTGVTVAEIYRFIEALNTWMLQTQSDRLPRLGYAKAFCRLPTEAEWAFGARGGFEVLESDPYRFDRPYPYNSELGKYEWHRQNSGSVIQECGSITFANPIGLKDMLGNVEELTASLFSPEYQGGRVGQFVVRGNNYSDSPDDFNVSHRTEFASHNQNGELRHPSKVGFRLALSAPVASTGKSRSELDQEFEKYLQTRLWTNSSPGPAVAARGNEDMIHYLQKQIDRIEEENRKLTEKNSLLEHTQTKWRYKATLSELKKQSIELQRALTELTDLTESTSEQKKLEQQLEQLATLRNQIENQTKKEKTEEFFLTLEPANLQELHDADELIINEENIKNFSVDVGQKKMAIQYLNTSSSIFRQGLNSIRKGSKKILIWREQQKLNNFKRPYKNSHAILIAIDDYSRRHDPKRRGSTGFDDLGMMVENTEALKKELIKYDFPEGNIHTFYNENATSKNIEKSIKLFYGGGIFDSADRLFFYFGGHGFADEEKNGYLVTYDFNRKKPDLTAISMEDFTSRYAKKIKTHHMLTAIDACHSGLSFKSQDILPTEDELRKFRPLSIIRSCTTEKTRNILLAGTEDQKALWENGGIFTKALISGIRGEADYNKDRIIEFRELALYIRDEVIFISSRKGVRQEPKDYILDRFGNGEFVFINTLK
ncbi:MAG: hypothetical protein D3916_02865 [Candidatus Electrothrix sp. MAN1_4]|nr:hypothetical protein [Candidatus Electrothrix sp. MAN1_4]